MLLHIVIINYDQTSNANGGSLLVLGVGTKVQFRNFYSPFHILSYFHWQIYKILVDAWFLQVSDNRKWYVVITVDYDQTIKSINSSDTYGQNIPNLTVNDAACGPYF